MSAWRQWLRLVTFYTQNSHLHRGENPSILPGQTPCLNLHSAALQRIRRGTRDVKNICVTRRLRTVFLSYSGSSFAQGLPWGQIPRHNTIKTLHHWWQPSHSLGRFMISNGWQMDHRLGLPGGEAPPNYFHQIARRKGLKKKGGWVGVSKQGRRWSWGS